MYGFLKEHNLQLNDGLSLDRLFNLKATYNKFICPCQVVSDSNVHSAIPCPCPTALDDIKTNGRCNCGVFVKQ